MSMLEIHSQAVESSNAVYHEFLLRYKKNQRLVYGIVEGKEDPLFYRGIIENSIPSDWDVVLFPAGRKSKVKELFDLMDWGRFPQEQIVFFFDRDLSHFVDDIETPQAENVYVTDGYSFENEAANYGVFKRMLEEVLNITKVSGAEDEVLRSLFDNNLSDFQDALSPVMAQIIHWMREKNEAFLDNIAPKDFFSFNSGRIVLKAEYGQPMLRVKRASESAKQAPAIQEVISEIEQEFRAGQGPEKFIRGKYIIWFLVESLLELHTAISKYCSSYPAPPKMKCAFGIGNGLVLIGPRIRCPTSLRDFLSKTFGKFIERGAVQ